MEELDPQHASSVTWLTEALEIQLDSYKLLIPDKELVLIDYMPSRFFIIIIPSDRITRFSLR